MLFWIYVLFSVIDIFEILEVIFIFTLERKFDKIRQKIQKG